MIKYALPAAAAAIALGTMTGMPQAVEAQTTMGPMPIATPDNPATTPSTMTTRERPAMSTAPARAPSRLPATNVSAGTTIVGQPQPGTYEDRDQTRGQDYGAPIMPMQPAMVPVPPGAVWIAGHYNWDPNAQNYVWLEGEFAQPPHPGAQWVAGHWQQTPTAWIWVDGSWN